MVIPKRRLAMESIAFQNDKTFEKEFDELMLEVTSKVNGEPLPGQPTDKSTYDPRAAVDRRNRSLNTDHSPKINALFKKRFGLSTQLTFIDSPFSVAYVYPLYISNHHVLLHKQWHGEQMPSDMLAATKKMVGRTGSVDLKSATVSGIFTEYQHFIGIDIHALVDMGCSYREVGAIILHEVGHAFTYYETANRIETGNKVLETILTNFRKPDFDVKEQESLLKEAERKQVITKKDMDDLLSSDGKIIFGSKLCMAVLRNIGAQHTMGRYDETSSEQMADNFASRMGYYKELATGLDKVHVSMFSPETSKLIYFFYTVFLIWQTITLILGIGIVLGAVAGLLVAPAGVLFYIAFLVVLKTVVFRLQGDDKRDMTYDDLYHRYNRVKHQIVEQLKDRSIPKEVTGNCLDALDEIDEIMKRTIKMKSVHRNIVNLLFPSARRAASEIEFQQLLEELSSNSLFIRAAELRIGA